MKIKLLSALIATAFAGVATTASAGVIQASYKAYAAEVFGTDVSLTAPTVGYSLALPLTGTISNPNSFSVTYTLTSGTWDPADLPGATVVSVGNAAQFLDAAPGVVDSTGTKITFAFLLNNGVTFPSGSTIVLGSNAVAGSVNNGATGDGAIKGVYTTLQTPALAANYCNPAPSNIGISIKLTNAAGSEFDSNVPGAINSTNILESNAATRAVVKASSAFGATAAANETSLIDVLLGSLGKNFTNPADVTASITKINLGSITFGPNPTLNGGILYDTNGTALYTVANANWGNPAPADGGVSQNGLTYTVTGKFVTGGTLNVTSDAAGLTTLPGVTVTFNTARTEAVVTVPQAALLVANVPLVGTSRTIYTTYTAPGTEVIPTAQFAVSVGTLARSAASNELATPVCTGNFYNLVTNGVRIDVRNYIPQVATNASGWYSVVRVINTDDQQTVSPVIQALLASGVLGASTSLDPVVSTNGTSGPFKPREVRYYTTKALDAALGAATNGPSYGAADVGGNARLRVSAPSSSLRVQNYIYNPATGNFVEASAAQSDEGPSAPQLNGQNNR